MRILWKIKELAKTKVKPRLWPLVNITRRRKLVLGDSGWKKSSLLRFIKMPTADVSITISSILRENSFPELFLISDESFTSRRGMEVQAFFIQTGPFPQGPFDGDPSILYCWIAIRIQTTICGQGELWNDKSWVYRKKRSFVSLFRSKSSSFLGVTLGG